MICSISRALLAYMARLRGVLRNDLKFWVSQSREDYCEEAKVLLQIAVYHITLIIHSTLVVVPAIYR